MRITQTLIGEVMLFVCGFAAGVLCVLVVLSTLSD